jgi:electron transport complex protein RnfE
MESFIRHLKHGVIDENPTFVQVLGMCPTLAVTTSAVNGLGMGLSVLVVLTLSNLLISLVRKVVPDKIRIPAFIVIIATLVTVIDMILQALFYDTLYQSLGLYIPLIVVNCIILGQAEAYASKHGPLDAAVDGFSMGLGFTLALTALGAVRELLGSGTLFGFTILPNAFPKILMMLMAPGGFFVLGILMALFNFIRNRKDKDSHRAESGKEAF